MPARCDPAPTLNRSPHGSRDQMHRRVGNLSKVAVALTDRQRGVDWMPGIEALEQRPVVGGADEAIGLRGQ
jgi:hypothetical protein